MAAPGKSTVALAIEGGIATVTLDRPDRHNAFDDALIAELAETLERLARTPDVRAVVLAATGPSFSAGADLAWMKRTAGFSRDENLADARRFANLLHRLDSLAKPTVARVHGDAYGGGVGLVAACDIAIAAEEARFCLAEVRLGLIPAVISPYVIRAMGSRAARRYFLTAERFDAAEAHRLGLVHLVVPAERLGTALGEVVQCLRATGPEAVAAAKKLIAEVEGRPIDADLIDTTARRIAGSRASREGREGVAAFLEKRRPSWTRD